MSEGVTRFDRDTQIVAAGPGRFEARIDRGWWIARGPNGGYVAAILMCAIEAAADDRERAPRSLTVHFLAPPVEGPVSIETQVERRGRSLTSVSARMLQQGRVVALAVAALSRSFPNQAALSAEMPEVQPPEGLEAQVRDIPMNARYDVRPAIGAPPFSGGSDALTGAWIRLAEPRRADAALVAAYADALRPAVFATLKGRELTRGIPTVDLTIHFRTALPQRGMQTDDFVLAVFRSRHARQGFVEEDGEIWSRDGQLLAQSRQLGILL